MNETPQQTVIATPFETPPNGVWERGLDYLVHTEVPLLVVVVLFVLYSAREGLGIYFKWRFGK